MQISLQTLGSILCVQVIAELGWSDDSNPIKHRGLLRNLRALKRVPRQLSRLPTLLVAAREIQAEQQVVDSEALIPRQVRLQRISPP